MRSSAWVLTEPRDIHTNGTSQASRTTLTDNIHTGPRPLGCDGAGDAHVRAGVWRRRRERGARPVVAVMALPSVLRTRTRNLQPALRSAMARNST